MTRSTPPVTPATAAPAAEKPAEAAPATPAPAAEPPTPAPAPTPPPEPAPAPAKASAKVTRDPEAADFRPMRCERDERGTPKADTILLHNETIEHAQAAAVALVSGGVKPSPRDTYAMALAVLHAKNRGSW